MIKTFTISICLIISAQFAFAQQQPLFSQYMMNGYVFNPAMAGADGYTSVNITARQQWIGFVNAPSTQSLSFQTRLMKRQYMIKSNPLKNNRFVPARDGRVGLGGFVYNDKNGLIDRTGVQLSYAYHIYLRRSQLSFGLSASAFQIKINREGISLLRPDDPVVNSGLDQAAIVPDASMGIYLRNRSYYAGVSATQLFQSPIKFGGNAYSEYKMQRHYYITGGYAFPLKNDYEFEPSFLVQASEQLIFQADITAKIYYKDEYWAGLSWRTSGAAVLLAGVRFNKFYIGYAFDYNFSNIRKHSFGSHELLLALKIGDDARRWRWLNRY